MITDERRARKLARALLRAVYMLAGDEGLPAHQKEVIDARARYAERTDPALSAVFDQVLDELRTQGKVPKSVISLRLSMLVAAFVGLIAGLFYLAYATMMVPGEAANTKALNAWIAAARAGRTQRPTEPGPTTDAALTAVAASVASEITRTTGSYSFGSGTSCFELSLWGADRITRGVAVRVTGDHDAPVVEVAGTSPACTCKRNGGVQGCTGE